MNLAGIAQQVLPLLTSLASMPDDATIDPAEVAAKLEEAIAALGNAKERFAAIQAKRVDANKLTVAELDAMIREQEGV